MADKDYTGLFILGGVGVGLYFLYNYLSSTCPGSSAGLCPIYNDLFGTSVAAAGGVTTTPVTSAPVTSAPVTSAPVTSAPVTSAPVTSTPPAAPPAAPPSSPTNVLTLQDAASFPYSGAITAAQMQALNSQLDAELQAGQVPQILGTSVLAYMLGWGGASKGASKSVYSSVYTFDGTYWNLTGGTGASAGTSGIGRVNLGRLGRYRGIGQVLMSGNTLLDNINNNEGDLYTGFVFSAGSAVPGIGAMGDERFAGSRVPRLFVHRGPGFNLRRAS